ncbi:hypothetical protein [Nocardiopsis potens]|uniref:hypothetical protein n=1 Tax=Nocardiopsis potens TaxID=1246458 RepID=UPI00038257A1|nr:hypothetical protein [Nocardiopsis potens]
MALTILTLRLEESTGIDFATVRESTPQLRIDEPGLMVTISPLSGAAVTREEAEAARRFADAARAYADEVQRLYTAG